MWLLPLSILVIAAALSVMLGMYTTDLVLRNALAPLDQLVIAAALGALVFIAALIMMGRRHAWAASLLTASAVTLWGTDAFVSWRIYHYMEPQTVAGIGVLLVVLAAVMGRWIQRLS